MIYRTNSDKLFRRGRSCVAGHPKIENWTNAHFAKEISVHASVTLHFCSAHFDDSCYNVNLLMIKSLKTKAMLKGNPILTVDVAGIFPVSEELTTERKQGQVCIIRLELWTSMFAHTDFSMILLLSLFTDISFF